MARASVLLADDDDAIVETTSMWLNEHGLDVRAAPHGLAAKRLLESGVQPSCIVLDLMMPVMSGWDFWDWVQTSKFADLPLIIWTATGLRQGSVGHAIVVEKSSGPLKLLEAIERCLRAPPHSAAPVG